MKIENLKSLEIVPPDNGNTVEQPLTPHRVYMEHKNVNINETDIESGLEWFVFKKRSQRARKQKFRRLREAG